MRIFTDQIFLFYGYVKVHSLSLILPSMIRDTPVMNDTHLLDNHTMAFAISSGRAFSEVEWLPPFGGQTHDFLGCFFWSVLSQIYVHFYRRYGV